MRQTFCVRFYCRKGNARKDGKAPVEISVIVNGERQMWQLPKKCKPEEFKTNKDIKLFCTSVENKINEIYTNLNINNEPITAYIIKDVYLNGNDRKSYTINKMFQDGLELKAKENVSVHTYNKYSIIPQLFYKATSYSPSQEANKINYSDILSFKAYIEKLHSKQTSVKELQRLKYFFILAFNSGKIKQNPFGAMKIKKNITEKEFLTYEEVNTISNLKITNDRLDKVRDVFLFMCFTGLEYADLINLKKEDVKINENKQYYIKKKRIKTGIEYIAILYEDAVAVWDLYDGELPVISDQKFNKYLKELATAAKIEKNITTLTARHTYACYLLNEKQLSIDIVQKMLGHTNPTQSKQYAKMLDNTVFKANNEAKEEKGIPVPHRETRREIEEEMEDLEIFKKLLELE